MSMTMVHSVSIKYQSSDVPFFCLLVNPLKKEAMPIISIGSHIVFEVGGRNKVKGHFPIVRKVVTMRTEY